MLGFVCVRCFFELKAHFKCLRGVLRRFVVNVEMSFQLINLFFTFTQDAVLLQSTASSPYGATKRIMIINVRFITPPGNLFFGWCPVQDTRMQDAGIQCGLLYP